ncbi:hypothetical protein HPB52_015155 [Rhipicephalus sanguineus]|uniref:Protein aurora borealis n=1 Tax=Rhipicephalus sanguineus TaxID=34632 RepID=A0A9D4Q724_RHISA|nr:hypothetical protein HPB52_015155 [Rhipicephalus sanguineus]
MAEFPHSFVRSSTSSSDSSAGGEEIGSLFCEPEYPRDGNTAMADKEPQTRRGIRRRRSSSNSISSNNKSFNRTNPFEVQAEQLSQLLCSPSMFRLRSPEAPASSRSFRWSIEQMAALFPVNIDEEELSSLQPEEGYDPFEEQSQQAIDLFFSSREIVPSPPEPQSTVRSPTPAADVVGENSGTQPERELHTATVWSQTTLSVPPEVHLSTVLGDYYTFHAVQNRRAAHEGIPGRRSVRRRLFCNVVGEELTNARQGGQPLSPVTDDSMTRTSSTTPLHMVPHSSPVSDSGFMRIRWSQGSDLEEQIAQPSPTCRLAGAGSLLVAATPPDQWCLRLPDVQKYFYDEDVNDRSFVDLAGFDSALDAMELTNVILPDLLELSPC